MRGMGVADTAGRSPARPAGRSAREADGRCDGADTHDRECVRVCVCV